MCAAKGTRAPAGILVQGVEEELRSLVYRLDDYVSPEDLTFSQLWGAVKKASYDPTSRLALSAEGSETGDLILLTAPSLRRQGGEGALVDVQEPGWTYLLGRRDKLAAELAETYRSWDGPASKHRERPIYLLLYTLPVGFVLAALALQPLTPFGQGTILVGSLSVAMWGVVHRFGTYWARS